ncbi:DNA cytosine methyltransferase [Salinibaculum rarum]|uniref:DNA cytosine methyltransferase n=1 Tax=Salinibaculum rarum TaxID=3058903 RepID=UPI00265D89F5|nr:DNA cytosine methyltransferase [Salinibaculum sp. KK48]
MKQSYPGTTVLDLYSGPGGVGHALHELGMNHVGVDVEDYSSEYPGHFFQMDASDITSLVEVFFNDEIDLMWLSPPCQAYSNLSYVHHDNPKQVHDTFYDLNVRGVIHYLEPDHYIIENVSSCGDLHEPTRINGFGVGYDFDLERHFETSFPCPDAIGDGESVLNMEKGIGDSYTNVAEAKGVPSEWGKTAVRSAIPKGYVQHLLHHCPSVDGVEPASDNGSQQHLTNFA